MDRCRNKITLTLCALWLVPLAPACAEETATTVAEETSTTVEFEGKVWTGERLNSLKVVWHEGFSALKVQPDFEGIAWLRDEEFQSGTLEMDLAALPRSYPTLALFGNKDGTQFDRLCLNARPIFDNRPRERLRDVTLTTTPSTAVVLNFNLSNEKYSRQDWFHFKLEFEADICRVFIDQDAEPALVFGNHFGKSGGSRLGLCNSVCYVRNVKITPSKSAATANLTAH